MYSDDSDIATAAVHNGICGVGERKKVCIQLLGPVDGLSSSRANGVSTRACAHWPGSFSFVESDGTSPQAAAAKMLALPSCSMSHYKNKDYSSLAVQSPSKISVSVSLYVINKLKQRLDHVSKDWESFQSEKSNHQPQLYNGHVYARVHNRSNSEFTIRRETHGPQHGPQHAVARFEHVDLDDTW